MHLTARPRLRTLRAPLHLRQNVFAASRIAQALVEHGMAVVRFDLTGLGASKGEFANTTLFQRR